MRKLISVAAWLGALLVVPALAAQDDGASRYAMLDGSRVHYQSYGRGSEAMVLIHGWTCNLDNWHDQIGDLSKRGRVLAVDLPGHGRSDKPEITYSMDRFAGAVAAVMQDAGVRRAVLIGHSMGTPVARQFYRQHPEQTLGIVIVDGPLTPFFSPTGMDSLLTALGGPAYQQVGDAMLAAFAGPGATPDMLARIRASYRNTPQHVVVGAMRALADPSIWAADTIAVPVLAILSGARSYPPDLEQRNRRIAPRLEQQMWAGVGHFLMMEQPKRFNDAVIAWLDANRLLKR